MVGKFVNSKRYSKNEKDEYMAILYFIDETENIKLQNEYNNSKSCVGIIMIDNYEENMQMLESEEKAQFVEDNEPDIDILKDTFRLTSECIFILINI